MGKFQRETFGNSNCETKEEREKGRKATREGEKEGRTERERALSKGIYSQQHITFLIILSNMFMNNLLISQLLSSGRAHTRSLCLCLVHITQKSIAIFLK